MASGGPLVQPNSFIAARPLSLELLTFEKDSQDEPANTQSSEMLALFQEAGYDINCLTGAYTSQLGIHVLSFKNQLEKNRFPNFIESIRTQIPFNFKINFFLDDLYKGDDLIIHFYNVPIETPFKIIEEKINAKHGKVIKIWKGNYPNFKNVYNGSVHAIVTGLKEHLPGSIRIGGQRVKIKYEGQEEITCENCQRKGHSKDECRNKTRCSKCDQIGHDGKSCPKNNILPSSAQWGSKSLESQRGEGASKPFPFTNLVEVPKMVRVDKSKKPEDGKAPSPPQGGNAELNIENPPPSPKRVDMITKEPEKQLKEVGKIQAHLEEKLGLNLSHNYTAEPRSPYYEGAKKSSESSWADSDNELIEDLDYQSNASDFSFDDDEACEAGSPNKSPKGTPKSIKSDLKKSDSLLVTNISITSESQDASSNKSSTPYRHIPVDDVLTKLRSRTTRNKRTPKRKMSNPDQPKSKKEK